MTGWAKLALLFFFLSVQAGAQSLRDPTLPPAEAGLAGPAPGGKAISPALAAMTIIVRDGRPYLAVGTRLYAQGELLGQARLERITETEVWLREGRVLRKVLQFPGIERHNASDSSKPGVVRIFVPTLNSKIEADAINSKNPTHD